MIDRPHDLPDFEEPPVAEVVLGLQFNTLEGLISPYVGRLWEQFKSEFPKAEEHPHIAPAFETFGQNPNLSRTKQLRFPVAFAGSRSFFINTGGTQLLQVQRDRFLHNWRKSGVGDHYPRFERMLTTFQAGVESLAQFTADERLGVIEPNQCEITYINHIPILGTETPYDAMHRIFDTLIANPSLTLSGSPEDARVLLRYVLKNAADTPIGRLTVDCEPVTLMDGTPIIQLGLTARGAPTSSDITGVADFLRMGRERIVHGFASITSPAMHRIWGRKI